MIADMNYDEKLNPTVIELRGRKLNIHLFLSHNVISKCLKLKD